MEGKLFFVIDFAGQGERDCTHSHHHALGAGRFPGQFHRLTAAGVGADQHRIRALASAKTLAKCDKFLWLDRPGGQSQLLGQRHSPRLDVHPHHLAACRPQHLHGQLPQQAQTDHAHSLAQFHVGQTDALQGDCA